MSEETLRITIEPGAFFNFIAKETNTDPKDYPVAIQAANLGILRGISRKLVRGANQKIFPDDIIPLLPNSIFKVFVQVSVSAAILNVTQIFGTQRINGQALDGNALQPLVPKEFNFPVGRDMKVNFQPASSTTIDYIRVVEFRIGQ